MQSMQAVLYCEYLTIRVGTPNRAARISLNVVLQPVVNSIELGLAKQKVFDQYSISMVLR